MKKTRGTLKKKKALPVGKTTSFPIVGIGASAGGLEAYQELLKNLSARPGMAFVFIMHLSPGHKSMLTELLAKSTKMPVKEIKSGTPIEINHIYVIPPGVNVSIAGGKLKLNKMLDAGLKRMPVDWFFRSLAEEQGNRGIGVILSGTATDGTLGAEAIKAEGGIIFAEDEKSAKYGGMPQSAIGAGCADFVLSPKRIAHELERIAKHPLISSEKLVKTDKSIIRSVKGLEGIFDILRSAKGLDFIHYKTPTISRRISRRMVLLRLENLRSYIKYLRENKDEVENLYEDLLLKVTSFFRDPKVFHTLEKRIIPAILKNKTKGQEVRIWVPGCSSGEEAYSIAMCLMESLGNKRSAVPVRIFATDVSESNIHKARQGIYGKNIQNDIAPERLKRFFTKTGSSYKVSKLLRDMCIFSKQNVFSDPPFSNLDLISCRNLIIYFQPILQKKVFHNFHYGLKPGGFLLLGNSESAGGYSNLFKTLDRTQRIFVKKYLSGEPKFKLGQKYYPPKKSEIKEMPGIRKGKEPDTGNLVERIVLSEYAPCGVLIDSDMEVVQFRGHTGRYLESAAGKPSHNLFKLAPRGLFQPLHTAIYKARGTKHTVKIEAQDVKYNGRKMRVNITVIPVKSGPLKEEFFLVLFDEISRAVVPQNLPKVRGKSAVKDEKYVESIQKELSETKEYLQTIIEEQENVNEEVKTANEEILSSNEELLSTNEELETAKEELQSSNEELITTNEELQNRNKEVFLLNNDLINLLTSINMPVVMMGTDLCVRRITPQAEKVLNVISSDVGRPISRIKLNVDIPDFEKILLEVVDTLHSKTFEVKDKDENWYLVYVRPYRTLDNKINGVVAIFDDITERKQVEIELKKANKILEMTAQVSQDIFRIKNRHQLLAEICKEIVKYTYKMAWIGFCDNKTKTVVPEAQAGFDEGYLKSVKITYDQTEYGEGPTGTAIKTKKPSIVRFIDTDPRFRPWHHAALKRGYHSSAAIPIFESNQVIGTLNVYAQSEDAFSEKEVKLLEELSRDISVALKGINEEIMRKQAEVLLRESEETLKEAQKMAHLGNWVWDVKTGNVEWSEEIFRIFHLDPKKFTPHIDSIMALSPWPEEHNRNSELIQRAMKTRETGTYEQRFLRPDKSIGYYFSTFQGKYDGQGNLTTIVGTIQDITDRKQLENELAQSKEEEFKAVFDNAVDGIVIVDMESKKFYRGNDAFSWMLGYSPQEIVNLGVMDIHPEKDLPYVIKQFERQAKGEIHLVEDLPVKRKDGSVFYADINAATITIAGKVYMIGFFRDITKRKQAEDLLRASEDRYRSLFLSSHDAIMTLEPPSWSFTSGNPATVKMFRVKNEAEFLTYTPWKLSPEYQPDGRISEEKSKEMIETAMRKGAYFFEWTHKRTNGENFSANVLLSRVEQGEKIFLHATVRDVTEQKRLEEEMKNVGEQKAATEIRSRFTSMVSHELRSPLGAIKEGINLVFEGLAGEINEEQKDLLGTAKRNTDRLGRLINNVLDFQKIASGKMEFDIQENDVNEVVREVNNAMGLLTKEKGLDLVINADAGIPRIKFDKDRIVQVLTNLVSNAIKYTEKGSITISTKQEDDTVHVIVQDTGMGIKAEDMKKLFQVFEQLDSTRDKKKGGTGLGLAISSDIILAHKGKIWAESQAGKGSAFHFTIPKNLKSKKKLGEILIEEKKITESDLKKALEKQEK